MPASTASGGVADSYPAHVGCPLYGLAEPVSIPNKARTVRAGVARKGVAVRLRSNAACAAQQQHADQENCARGILSAEPPRFLAV